MIRLFKLGIGILLFFSVISPALSIEVAPRLTDREIIESLTELKAGQKALNDRFEERSKNVDKQFDTLRQDIDRRFDGRQSSFRPPVTVHRFEMPATNWKILDDIPKISDPMAETRIKAQKLLQKLL